MIKLFHKHRKLTIEEAIDILRDAFKNDPDYRYGWQSNIAMSFLDAETFYRRKNGKENKYLNYGDKGQIANDAAEMFLRKITQE